MRSQRSSDNKKLAPTIGLIIIVAAIAAGVAVFAPRKSSSQSVATPTPAAAAANASPVSSSVASMYKDGTYNATGSYDSPGGRETVSLRVTLRGGAVADSAVTTTGGTPTGKQYQGEFIAGYKAFVTGKNIDAIRLSKVSGSSLTSEGFNNALAKIRIQAKA